MQADRPECPLGPILEQPPMELPMEITIVHVRIRIVDLITDAISRIRLWWKRPTS